MSETPSSSRDVEAIYSILGQDVVLLTLPRGQKRCFVPDWPKMTLAATKTNVYQSELATGDVGVLLGSAGNGICTIDCDSDEAAEVLLNANPAFSKTFRTRGA
ncbi:MAG: hypothetical protein EXS41_00345, partial [Opitutaceae bacterium]|nr:hypothetical protein [Opitutaceae bacterium]